MKRVVACAVLSLLISPGNCATPVAAGVTAESRDDDLVRRWINIGPGAPGVWAPIAVDPAGTGTIYVGSIGGGVRKSTDGGASWSSADNGFLNDTAVYSLAMDAVNSDLVYAGLFTSVSEQAPGGLFTSSDGGLNWTRRVGVVPVTLTTDPHVQGVAFAGLLGGNILKTVDGGQTWSTIFTGTSPVPSIAIDPTSSANVYAATLAGAFKSTDGGTTWTPLSTLHGAVWGFAIDPVNPATLYAATNGDGVWTSADFGNTWQTFGTLPSVPFSLVVDPATGTVFAGTAQGVWATSDSGSTWQSMGLEERLVVSITIGLTGFLYAGTSVGPAIYDDSTQTWTDADPTEGGAQAFGYSITVDPNGGRRLFCTALGSKAIVSNDKGRSWSPLGETYTAREPRRITVDPTNSNRVYSGSFYSGLYKSLDGGATWERRDVGSGYSYVWIAVVDPLSPNVVYAGTSGEGLFKSSDYGDSWTLILGASVLGSSNLVQGVTVDPRDDTVVFAATNAGIFRSHDGGDTWHLVLPVAAPNPGAWSVTIVAGDSHVVYATTKFKGVFRSDDDGLESTWTAINNGITNLVMGRAAPVIVDAHDPQVLYVGSEGGGGVFRSTNGGDEWSAMNTGLLDTSVFGLAADPHRSGTLYVSGPHGVFATRTGSTERRRRRRADLLR